jgi:GT2 family glycosyltransferase
MLSGRMNRDAAPSPTPKIAAIFSTFNRKEMALTGLARLKAQTRRPDRVIVADNASSDGTPDAVRQAAASWDAIRLIDLGDNLGNGAGIKAAMEFALADGADWIWILDDDSWPLPDGLEQLAAQATDPSAAYASLVAATDSEDLAWPLMIREESGVERVAFSRADFASAPTSVIRGGWLGGFVSRAVIDRVGLPDAAFFLRGEDEDYNSRFLEAGIPTICVRNSVLEHPKAAFRRITIFGKHLFYEPGLAPWKTYYTIRNRAWLRIRYSGSRLAGIAKALAYVGLNAIFAVALDDRKLIRLGTIMAGGKDALAGRLGKTVMPG